MHLLRGTIVSFVCCALLVSMAPADAVAPAKAPAAASRADKPKTDKFRIKAGPTFNSPIGNRSSRRAIINKILNAINHSPRGSKIQIMSWNMMSAEGVNALLRAQKRGVVVRLIMDQANVDEDTPNPYFRKLKAGLKQGNKGKKKWSKRSATKLCQNSCRGSGGAAHAKFYLFSKVGRSRDVLIQGSANFTTAAAFNQWNEIFTYVGREKLYDFAGSIFAEMWKDKKASRPYRSVQAGRFGLFFSPYAGKDFTRDPIYAALNRVKCRGAKDGAGNFRNRTIIRSAPDVIRGDRGNKSARKLKSLWDKGCDVRIVYTVMGRATKKILRGSGGRGAVPMRHLVQDFDGDGEFDNYFHIKVLTINGVLGNDRSSYLTFNGSSNTSDLSTHSDENNGTFIGRSPLMAYQKHIDYWFDHAPTSTTSTDTTGGAADRRAAVDPYAHVDMD